jgi:hypothetical protein
MEGIDFSIRVNSDCEYISIFKAVWMMTSIEAMRALHLEAEPGATFWDYHSPRIKALKRFSNAALTLADLLCNTDSLPKQKITITVLEEDGGYFAYSQPAYVKPVIVELLHYVMKEGGNYERRCRAAFNDAGLTNDEPTPLFIAPQMDGAQYGQLNGVGLNRAELVALLDTQGIKHLFIDDAGENKRDSLGNAPAVPVAFESGDTSESSRNRKERLPVQRSTTEALLLIDDVLTYYSITYLDELSGLMAWARIVSGEYPDNSPKRIKEIASNKRSITLETKDNLDKTDFLEKYRKRFKKHGTKSALR